MDDYNDDNMVEMTEPGKQIDLPPSEPTHDLDDNLMHASGLKTAVSPHVGPKKNSPCYDISMPVLVVLLLISGVTVILVANNWRANDPYEIAKIYHEKHPFIDGKNALPYAIKAIYKGDYKTLNLNDQQEAVSTDIPRIRAGKLGGVVWSSMMPCGIFSGNEGPTAVQRTLYQMDIIYGIIAKYHSFFQLVTSPEKASESFSSEHVLPSMISIEGGHQIHDDLAALRMFQKMGAVSMALTAECSTSWAETGNPSNTQYRSVQGLTNFGLSVISEMNRIGMIVDLSHTSESTMAVGIEASQTPVIFSLSGARALCDSTLNVPDSLFSAIAKNGGLIMVPFFPPAICVWATTLYDEYRAGIISAGDLAKRYQDSPTACGIEEVFAHVEYLKHKLGVQHVGLSTNFDNNLGMNIKGLEDISKLLNLSARFIKAGYSEADITAIIGGNFLRVWNIAEEKSKEILDEELGRKQPHGLWH